MRILEKAAWSRQKEKVTGAGTAQRKDHRRNDAAIEGQL